MADNNRILSAEDEAKLLQPIDEYIEKIQEQIDALRVDGSDKVDSLKNQIAVAKENKNLYVTELGEAVNNIMKKAFPTIVDVNFTANMETLLDSVGEGKVKWKEVIRNFYPDLDEAVKLAEKELENVKIEDEVTDVICDKCGRNMVIKYGPHGKFLGCPDFLNVIIQNHILKK